MSNKMKNELVGESICSLYLQSKLADVHFAFTEDGQTIKVPAHKTILAAASKVFEAMFFGQLKENEVVEIVDADSGAFEEYLQFFYLPEVTLSVANIESVARLADKYDMNDCLNTCAKFLEYQLTEDNMFWGYQLAISLNNQELKRFCERQIKFFTSDAFESDMFLQCDRTVLKSILQLDSLLVEESELFDACMTWAIASCQRNGLDETDPENLKAMLGDCFHLVRFVAMSYEEISLMLTNRLCEGMFTRNELVDILRAKSATNVKSELFSNVSRLMPQIKWSSVDVLKCERHSVSGNYINLRNHDCTWFSSSSRIVLGGQITCTSILHVNGHYFLASPTISIIEHKNETAKVLFTGTLKYHSFNPASIALPQFVIHPKKMYEVRVVTNVNVASYRYLSVWKPEIKLDEDTTITFHLSSSADGDLRGLVSSLWFNRINIV